MFMFSPFPENLTVHPLVLLASAFFGWLAATDAYPVLDRHAASLARFTSTGLAHNTSLISGSSNFRQQQGEARYFPL
jgi:hypothetical protein